MTEEFVPVSSNGFVYIHAGEQALGRCIWWAGFGGFQQSCNLHLKLLRGKMILVYQGDDVQKITNLEFGSSSAFLLSFSYSSHIPHYLVSVSSLCVLQLVCARLFVASNRCIAFFFSFSELIESWSTVEEISHKLQGDYCNELQLYSIPLHAIMGWGKKSTASSVVSTEICQQSRGWFHEWCILDETFSES